MYVSMYACMYVYVYHELLERCSQNHRSPVCQERLAHGIRTSTSLQSMEMYDMEDPGSACDSWILRVCSRDWGALGLLPLPLSCFTHAIPRCTWSRALALFEVLRFFPQPW